MALPRRDVPSQREHFQECATRAPCRQNRHNVPLDRARSFVVDLHRDIQDQFPGRRRVLDPARQARHESYPRVEVGRAVELAGAEQRVR